MRLGGAYIINGHSHSVTEPKNKIKIGCFLERSVAGIQRKLSNVTKASDAQKSFFLSFRTLIVFTCHFQN